MTEPRGRRVVLAVQATGCAYFRAIRSGPGIQAVIAAIVAVPFFFRPAGRPGTWSI